LQFVPCNVNLRKGAIGRKSAFEFQRRAKTHGRSSQQARQGALNAGLHFHREDAQDAKKARRTLFSCGSATPDYGGVKKEIRRLSPNQRRCFLP